jgi:uncharacterized protein (DUF2252 family)
MAIDIDDPGPTHTSYAFRGGAIPVAQARDRGRILRGQMRRRDFARFDPPDRDPVAILEDQHEDRIPDLVPVRIGRMLESPFSYYRGTAAVMANDLASEARTGIEVVVCGDAHISNFGFFAAPDRRVLFDLNDFDETAFGPWEWDVKRLVASVVIGARQLGFDRAQCTDAALATAQAYRSALNMLFGLTALERYYYRVESDRLLDEIDPEDQRQLHRVIKKAKRRTSDRVLSNITTVNDDGHLHIVDEFPIIRHDDQVSLESVGDIYASYRLTCRTDIALLLEQFTAVDAVLRVVGVGSVGTRCGIALLIGPSDEPLFLQMKEAPPSVLETYGHLHEPSFDTAAERLGKEGWRVVAGQRILQAASDPFLGWVTFGGRDYYLRQFRDMKGSVELEALNASQFLRYGVLCASVLGRAHAQSRDAAIVAGYLDNGGRFDESITAWSHAYADQVERDFDALTDAVEQGRLAAEEGV